MNRDPRCNGPGVDVKWCQSQPALNLPFANPSVSSPLTTAFSLANNPEPGCQLTLPPPFANQLSATANNPFLLQWLQTQPPNSALSFCLSSVQQNLMSPGGGAFSGKKDSAMQTNVSSKREDNSCRRKNPNRESRIVFQCTSCSELFISKKNWLRHCFYRCRDHLTCQVCHFKFATRPELLMHVTNMKHSKMFRYGIYSATKSEYDQLKLKEHSDNNQGQRNIQNNLNQHKSDVERVNEVQPLENVVGNTVVEDPYDSLIQEDSVDPRRQSHISQRTNSVQGSLMSMDVWRTGAEKRMWDEEMGDSSVPKKIKDISCDDVYLSYNRRDSETALQTSGPDQDRTLKFSSNSVVPCANMKQAGNSANFPSLYGYRSVTWPSTLPNSVNMGPVWHCSTPEIDRTENMLFLSQQQLYQNASMWPAGMVSEIPEESPRTTQTVPGDNVTPPWPPVLPSDGNIDNVWSSSVPHAQYYQQPQAASPSASVKWHLSPWQDATSHQKECSLEEKGYSRRLSVSESSADKVQPKNGVLSNKKHYDSNGDSPNNFLFKNRGLIEITLPNSIAGAMGTENVDSNRPGKSGSPHKASIYEYQRQRFSVNNNTDQVCRDPRLRVDCKRKTPKSSLSACKEQSTSKDTQWEARRTSNSECSTNKDGHEHRNNSDVRTSKKNISLLLDKDTKSYASMPPKDNTPATETGKTLVLSKRRGNLRAMLAQAINMTKSKSPPDSDKVSVREVGVRCSKKFYSGLVSQRGSNRERSDGDNCKVSSTSQYSTKDTEEVSRNDSIGGTKSAAHLGVSVSNAVLKNEETIEYVSRSQCTDSQKQNITNHNRSKISFNIKHKKSFSLARADFPLTPVRKSTEIFHAEDAYCKMVSNTQKKDDYNDEREIVMQRQPLTDKVSEIKKELAADCFSSSERQTDQPEEEYLIYNSSPEQSERVESETKQSEGPMSPSRQEQSLNLPLRTWHDGKRFMKNTNSPSGNRESDMADSDKDETVMVKEKMLMSLAEVSSLGSLSPYTDEEDDKVLDNKQDDSNQTSYYVLGKHYDDRSRVRNLEMRYQFCIDKLECIDLFFKGEESASNPSDVSGSMVSKEQKDSEMPEVDLEETETNSQETDSRSSQPFNTQTALPKGNRLLSILMRESLESSPSSSAGKHGSRSTIQQKTQKEDKDYSKKRSVSHTKNRPSDYISPSEGYDVRQKRLRCSSCYQTVSPVHRKKSRRHSSPSKRKLDTRSPPLRRSSLPIQDSAHRRKMSPDEDACCSCSSSTEQILSSSESPLTRCGSPPILEDSLISSSPNSSTSPRRSCSPPSQRPPLNSRSAPQNSPLSHDSPLRHRSPPRHVSFINKRSHSSSGSHCWCYSPSKYSCLSRDRISESISPQSGSPSRQISPPRSPSRCSSPTRHRSPVRHKSPPRCILPTKDRSSCRHRSLSSCSSTSRHNSLSRYSWASRQNASLRRPFSGVRKPRYKSPIRKSSHSSHNASSRHKSLRRYKSRNCRSRHGTPPNRSSPPSRYTLSEHFDISSRFSPLRQTSTSKHSSLQYLPRESSVSPTGQSLSTHKMTGNMIQSSRSRSRSKSEKSKTDMCKECHCHQRSSECRSPSQITINKSKSKPPIDIENRSTETLTEVLSSIQGTRDIADTSFDDMDLDWDITEEKNCLAEFICSEKNNKKSKCRYHSKYAHDDHGNRKEVVSDVKDSLQKCKSGMESQAINTITNELFISSEGKQTLEKPFKPTTVDERDLISLKSTPISVDVRHDTLSNKEMKMPIIKDDNVSCSGDSSNLAEQAKYMKCMAEEKTPCVGRQGVDIQDENVEITATKKEHSTEYEVVSWSYGENEITNKPTKICKGSSKDLRSDPGEVIRAVESTDVKEHLSCEGKEVVMKPMDFGDLEKKDTVCTVDETNEHPEILSPNVEELSSDEEKDSMMSEMTSKNLEKGCRTCHVCYDRETDAPQDPSQNSEKLRNMKEYYLSPTEYPVPEFDMVSMTTLEIAAADSSTNPAEISRVTKVHEKPFYLADSSGGIEEEDKSLSPEIYGNEDKKEKTEDAVLCEVDALAFENVDSMRCEKSDSLMWDKETYKSAKPKEKESARDEIIVSESVCSQEINESARVKTILDWTEHEVESARLKKVDEEMRAKEVDGSTKHNNFDEATKLEEVEELTAREETEYSPRHKGVHGSVRPVGVQDSTDCEGVDESLRHEETCESEEQDVVDELAECEQGELVEHEGGEESHRSEENYGPTGQEEVEESQGPRENSELSGQEEVEESQRPRENSELSGQEEADEPQRIEDDRLRGHEEVMKTMKSESDEPMEQGKRDRPTEFEEVSKFKEDEVIEGSVSISEVGELTAQEEIEGSLRTIEVCHSLKLDDQPSRLNTESTDLMDVDRSTQGKAFDIMTCKVGESMVLEKIYDPVDYEDSNDSTSLVICESVCQEKMVEPTQVGCDDSMMLEGESVGQESKDSTSDAIDNSTSHEIEDFREHAVEELIERVVEDPMKHCVEESTNCEDHDSTGQQEICALKVHKVEDLAEHFENSKEHVVKDSTDHEDSNSTEQHEIGQEVEDSIEHFEDSKNHENGDATEEQEGRKSKDNEVEVSTGHGVEDVVGQEAGESTCNEVRELIELKIDGSVSHEESEESAGYEIKATIGLEVEGSTSHEVQDSGRFREVEDSTSHEVQDSRKFREVEDSLGHEIDDSARLEKVWEPTGHEVEDSAGCQECDEPMGRELVDEITTHEVDESAGLFMEQDQPVKHRGAESIDHEVGEMVEIEVDASMEHSEVDHLREYEIDAPAECEKATKLMECESETSTEYDGVIERTQHEVDASTEHDESKKLTECEVDSSAEYEDEAPTANEKTSELEDREVVVYTENKEVDELTECNADVLMGNEKVNMLTKEDAASAELEEVDELMEHVHEALMEHKKSVELTGCEDGASMERKVVDSLAEEVAALTEHEEIGKLTGGDGDPSAEVDEVDELMEFENETSIEHEKTSELMECKVDSSTEHEEVGEITEHHSDALTECKFTEREGDMPLDHKEVDDWTENKVDASTELENFDELAEYEVDSSVEYKAVNELTELEVDQHEEYKEVKKLTECEYDMSAKFERVDELMGCKAGESIEHDGGDQLMERESDVTTEHEEGDRSTEHEVDASVEYKEIKEQADLEDHTSTEHQGVYKSMEHEIDASMEYKEIKEQVDLEDHPSTEHEGVYRSIEHEVDASMECKEIKEQADLEDYTLTEHQGVCNSMEHEIDTLTEHGVAETLSERETDPPTEDKKIDEMVELEEHVKPTELETGGHENPALQFESTKTISWEDQPKSRKFEALLEVIETQTWIDSEESSKTGGTYNTGYSLPIPMESEDLHDLRGISSEYEVHEEARVCTFSGNGDPLNVKEKDTLDALLQLEGSVGTEDEELKVSAERNSDVTSSDICNSYGDVNDISCYLGDLYPSDYESDESLPCLETLLSSSCEAPTEVGNNEEFHVGSEENQTFESSEGKSQQVNDRDRPRCQRPRVRKARPRSKSRKSAYKRKKNKSPGSCIRPRNPPSRPRSKTRSSPIVQARYVLRSTSRYRNAYERYRPQSPEGLQGNEEEQMYQPEFPKTLLNSEDGEDKESTDDQNSKEVQAPENSQNPQDPSGEAVGGPCQSEVDSPTKASESLRVASELDNVVRPKTIPPVTVCITSRVRNHCPACGAGLVLDTHTTVSISTGNLRVKCPKCLLAIIMRGVLFKKICHLRDPPPGPYCKTKIFAPNAANPKRKQRTIKRLHLHKGGCGVK